MIFNIEFIHNFQYGVIFNKMNFSNINLLEKALLIVVLVFLELKIRNASRCNIVSSEDLKLKAISANLCHLIRKFSHFSQFYLSLVNFLVFNETCVCFLILHCFTYTSYTSYTSICLSNLFWDCANSIVNIFSVHNDFNATNNFLNFPYSFVEVYIDVSYDGNRNLRELMNKSKHESNGSNKNAILLFLFLTG